MRQNRVFILGFSVLIMLVLALTLPSCSRYKAERQEKQRHEMELRAKYYGRFFCWVQDRVLDEINDEIASVGVTLDYFDSDYRYTYNSLQNAIYAYDSAYYQNDDMDEMKDEVEEAINRLEDIESSIEEIRAAIGRITDKLESITGEGMSGEDIIKLLPYMSGDY